MRWLHIYISMFSLLAILFFSLTGITLNHPDWAFTNAESKRESKGQLPQGWKAKDGKTIDWLTVGEYLRAHDGVRGSVTDKEADEEEGSMTYKAPGYSADCFFNVKTGSYDLTVSTMGVVGVMNDFHRGTTAGAGWKWLIDVSGLMLAIVALTGLGLLYYLKKMRVAAFLAMGVGAIIIAILMKLAF
ncbi:peptidase [bacterium]|nr:MAG: peptidase [bacterium]